MSNEQILAEPIRQVTEKELKDATRPYTVLDALKEGSEVIPHAVGTFGDATQACFATTIWLAAKARGQLGA